MREFGDPEIELWLPSGLIQAGGTYRGHAEVLDWMKEWVDAWEEIHYTPGEVTEAGDSVLVRVLYDGRGKGSGVRVEGRSRVPVRAPQREALELAPLPGKDPGPRSRRPAGVGRSLPGADVGDPGLGRVLRGDGHV